MGEKSGKNLLSNEPLSVTLRWRLGGGGGSEIQTRVPKLETTRSLLSADRDQTSLGLIRFNLVLRITTSFLFFSTRFSTIM